MEFIERPNPTAVAYLASITYKDFMTGCKDEAEQDGLKKPTEKDMKTWYSILQSYIQTNRKTKCHTKRIYTLSKKSPSGLGGRLFCANSAQGIWNVYRGLLFRGITTDLDMVNCHPVVLRYICRLHNEPCAELDYYIQNRDACLAEFPSRAAGKNAYLVSTNMDKPLRGKDLPDQLKRYDKEMKRIQKKLTSLPEYKHLMVTIDAAKRESNYNGAAINRILCYYEDVILGYAIHILNTRNLEIAIPMFDGCVFYGDHYANTELLREIEAYVESQMEGLNMKWDYKPHSDVLQIPEDFDPTSIQSIDTAVDNDKQAADLVYALLKNRLKYCDKQLYFRNTNNVWTVNENETLSNIRIFVMESAINKKTDDGSISYSQNYVTATHIAKTVIEMAMKNSDDMFYQKFVTSTRGKLCFVNGVLDIPTKKFISWEEATDVYTTQLITTPYNSVCDPAVYQTVYNDVFVKIFDEDAPKMLQFLARGIAGHIEDKAWGSFIGNRNCGKGVVEKLCKSALETYCGGFNSSVFLYERNCSDNGDQAKKLAWAMDLEFARLAFGQEQKVDATNKNVKMDGGLIKKMNSGGDIMCARRNYCDARQFVIQARQIFASNDVIPVSPLDALETCVTFTSSKQFKSKEEIDKRIAENANPLEIARYAISDPLIKDKCGSPEWKTAFFHIILAHYKTSLVPFDANDTEENTNMCDTIFADWEITRNHSDRVNNAVLKQWLSEKELNISLKKLKIDLLSFGCKEFKGTTRGFTGLKKISHPSPSEENPI